MIAIVAVTLASATSARTSVAAGGYTCAGHPATIVGTPGDDRLVGTPGPDVIVGRRGFDTILGRGGDDIICGEADGITGPQPTEAVARVAGPIATSGDEIRGGAGDDLVRAGPDADTIHGDQGDDRLSGGGGYDTILPGPGRDLVWGNGDPDQVSYADAAGAVHVDLAAGTATGEGLDRLRGINQIGGSPFADLLLGDDHLNVIEGEGGDDRIYGRDGNDGLTGERGDDLLVGGQGHDSLVGGPGDDTCRGGEDVLSC
jgi:Ca2+-binding RTX toxin-like protein